MADRMFTFSGKDLSSDPRDARDPRPRSLANNRDAGTFQVPEADRASVAAIMEANQGLSEQEAYIALRVHRKQQAALAGPQVSEQSGLLGRVTSALQAARTAVQPAANNLVNLAGDVTAALGGDFSGIGRRTRAGLSAQAPAEFQQAPESTVGRVAAEVLNPVPGSAGEAAAIAASGGLALTPVGRAAGILPSVARAAVPTVAGLAADQSAGEPDAAEGAIWRAGAAGLMEGGIGAVGLVRRIFGGRRIQQADVTRVAEAMSDLAGKPIPASPAGLWGTLNRKDPASVRALAGAEFRESLGTVRGLLGDNRQFSVRIAGRRHVMGFDEFMDTVSGKGLIAQQGSGTAATHAALSRRELVSSVLDSLRGTGDARDALAAQVLDRAWSQYGARQTVVRLLGTRGVLDEAGNLNMAKLQEAYRTMLAKDRGLAVDRRQQEILEAAIFRGAGPSAGTDIPGQLPSVFVRALGGVPTPTGASVRELGRFPRYVGTPEQVRSTRPIEGYKRGLLSAGALLGGQNTLEALKDAPTP